MDSFLYYEVYTELGNLGIVWSIRDRSLLVERILLPNEVPGENPVFFQFHSMDRQQVTKIPGEQVPKEIFIIEEHLQRCIDGKWTNTDLEIFNFTRCSEFQKAVLLADYKVPPGWITTYGRIADKIGKPGSARAIGRALATNPFPLIIPCHRAMHADGGLGGYRGGVQSVLKKISYSLGQEVQPGQLRLSLPLQVQSIFALSIEHRHAERYWPI